MGSDNSRGVFDNVEVQVLPPQVTYDRTHRPDRLLGQLDAADVRRLASGGSGYTGTAASTGGVVPVSLDGDQAGRQHVVARGHHQGAGARAARSPG